MNVKLEVTGFTKAKFLPLSIAFIVTAAFMMACGSKTAADPKKTPPPAEYGVLSVTPHQTTLFDEFPVNIQGQQNIEIRPKIDGYIDMIYVDEGATVRKGQLLFRINAPQYEQEVRNAQAAIKIAQADVSAAQMQVNKVNPLVQKNIISKYELQSAQYSLQSRQAALAQAQVRLANARINLGYTAVTSPVNGVVGIIPYKIGSLVSSNTPQPLTTVSNIGNIYAYFAMNEKQSLAFNRNTKGATIQERLKTLPPVSLILADGTEFAEKGKVETASGIINTETGSVSVRATFANPGNLIRSGSSGVIRIPHPVDSALIIPQKATYEIQGKKFVYIVGDSNKVKSVEVKVMTTSNGQYFVVTDGLQPNDKIVLDGVSALREGLAIKPKTINTDSLYQQLLK